MRERFTKTLSEGTWAQTARQLSAWQQTKAFFRIVKAYVFQGSPEQRSFFFAIFRFSGRRVNKASVINILLLALSWNEFANSLKAEQRAPDAKPIVFRPEYMVPVEEQTLGRSEQSSGVERDIARMTGPKLIQIQRQSTSLDKDRSAAV